MVPGRSRECGLINTKNSTNEASMLLKALNGCWNEAKKYLKLKELSEIIGYEAKKWLKTKHIDLLTSENCARLAHQLAQVRA